MMEDVAIFWDYENCPVPTNSSGYALVNSIRSMAQIYGPVKSFKAYLGITDLPVLRTLALRSELQSSGVSLIDCPHNGRKDVADKMIIVDMLAHAIDSPAPSTIILISGDRDFAYALSILRLRCYQIVLCTTPHAHTSLIAQASLCIDWHKAILNPSDASSNSAANISGRPKATSRENPQFFPLQSFREAEIQHAQSNLQRDVDIVPYLRMAQRRRSIDSPSNTYIGNASGDERPKQDPSTNTEVEPECSRPGWTPPIPSGSGVTSSNTSSRLPTQDGPVSKPSSHEPNQSSQGLPLTTNRSTNGNNSSQISGGVALGLISLTDRAQALSATCVVSPAMDEVRCTSLTNQFVPRSANHQTTSCPTSSLAMTPPSAPTSFLPPPPPSPSLSYSVSANSPIFVPSKPSVPSTPATVPPTVIPVNPFKRSVVGPDQSAEAACQPPVSLSSVIVPETPVPATPGPVTPALAKPDLPDTPATTKLPELAKVVAPQFAILVRTLQEHRAKGLLCPTRSKVAVQVAQDGLTYKKAGVSKFGEYTALAAKDGIILLGGREGDAWISLQPEWHNAIVT